MIAAGSKTTMSASAPAASRPLRAHRGHVAFRPPAQLTPSSARCGPDAPAAAASVRCRHPRRGRLAIAVQDNQVHVGAHAVTITRGEWIF